MAQKRLFTGQLLPLVVLFAAILAGKSAANAQQFARDETSSAPAANPTQQITALDVGNAQFLHRHYQAAIDAYKKIAGNSPDVWNRMGIAYEMLFDLKDAARCFRKSLRLEPEDARVLSNLATVYDSEGDHRKAERLYRQAMKLNPGMAVVALDLGTNLMIQNKYDQGWEMYQRAMSLDRNVFDHLDAPVADNPITSEQNGAVNYYRAKGYAQAGMNSSAIKYLRKAMNEGFANCRKVAEDSTFARLRGNPEFERLLREQSRQ